MSIRLRVFLGFLVITILAVVLIINLVFSDLEPRYRETIEEPLVDFSRVVAALLELQSPGNELDASPLQTALERARARKFEARIFDHLKTSVDLRAYVTDNEGRLIFDSEDPAAHGDDYSRWRDVRYSLDGFYGARTSRDIADNSDSSIMFVAAPIFDGNSIKGVVSIGKPTRSFNEFIEKTKERLFESAALIAAALVVLGLLLASFLSRPIERLTRYALAIAAGERPRLPKLGGGEIGRLGKAFESMRETLEGKRYVEKYVETLTHEVKSPLSAIRGAAELLSEPMAGPDRDRFLANIKGEAQRLQQLVEKLLLLSRLEARQSPRETSNFDLGEICRNLSEQLAPRLAEKGLRMEVQGDVGEFHGDRFLIEHAVRNLLDNAIDFSPANGLIQLTLSRAGTLVAVEVTDQGPGVPEFALPRVFERFYSLTRPGSDRKSTGLGLSFVREVAHLHGGTAMVKNRAEGGTKAFFTARG